MKQEPIRRNGARETAKTLVLLSGITAAFWACSGQAQDDRRFYFSPMYSFVFADNDRLTDDGDGGILAFGKQIGPRTTLELYYLGATFDAESGSGSSDYQGYGGAISYFPFGKDQIGGTRGLYGLLGVAFGDGESDIDTSPNTDDSRYLFDVGVGYLLPILWDVKLRLDARYRFDRLEDPFGDFDGRNSTSTSGFEEPVVSVGLLVPLGRRPEPPPPPPPVVVVAPIQICLDGQDNDGDGLVDFPADPGCSSAEDNDETDPPQCSDGKDNDGDGLVDFPADKGCSAADDNDEVDPCKTPAAGERVSLKGCGLGDVIVLRGVNFEFDKDRLTVNAKTILDNVAEELAVYPEITIELGGHTDAKGSDEYNQALSDRRAASVVRYLKGKDIAAERMTSAGYGEAQPVADNETDEGRELNRRVELKITSGIAPGSATTTSDGSSTTLTEATTTEPAVEAPAADAPAANATEGAPLAEAGSP